MLLVLGEFPARSFEELFQGVKAIPWENYIPRDGAFPVKGYSITSQLHSAPACQSIVKKAMVERLKSRYGLEQFPETGVKYQVRFSIFKDQVVIGLDSSGEGLYKRGYRAVGVEAPLRETLAAAMVLLSRYRGRDPFCDPFCGSGTIPIEAALIAKNRAPGLDRSFSAQKWKNMPSKLWMEAADEAMDKEFHGTYDIWGGDIDPKAVDVAYENAALNGIGADTYTGEAGDILSDKDLQQKIGGGYQVMLANIVADVIIGISPQVRPFLKEGGLFLCSGIIDDRAEEVADHLRRDGWEILETHTSEGWFSFLCR